MLVSNLNLPADTSEGQPTSPSIMVFAPWYYGHHPTYLRHLISYWKQRSSAGTLHIVVMPPFLKEHQDIVALASETNGQPVRFVSLTVEEQIHLESTASNLGKAMVQYQLMTRYAKQLNAAHGLLMHLDSCLVPLVLGLKLPCPFSGIYFRPTFHYNTFSHYAPTWKERIQHLRERFFLSRILAHPQFKTLLSLDSLSIEPINQLARKHAKAVYLPDPVEFTAPPVDTVNALRNRLGVEPDRQIFLMFGSLAEDRKGTHQLLESLHQLEPDLCRKVCILLVGEPFPERQQLLETWIAPIRQTLPVQVVTQFGYIPESDVPLYFQLADVVLAPYQKHAGMSGIVLLAAIAQKPLLSSNYGLMGELVKRYSLGVSVDTTQPAEIAKGLAQLLSQSPEALCNFETMQAFVRLNTTEQFANTIFQHL